MGDESEDTKIAIVAQQWTSAKFLINENLPISDLKKNRDSVHIHFEYLTQRDPDIIYQDLISGKEHRPSTFVILIIFCTLAVSKQNLRPSKRQEPRLPNLLICIIKY